ncbi:NAD(P)H-dependent oxidoreductase [Runella zeae]|uniref:NAD(P)H-dependent oxidoreductase n=1 Tax=Runella zeae TaxID=94255 RepID=UPI00040C2B96|nr:NAD(P)H-dependent oxidoreductase [Runella zeae]
MLPEKNKVLVLFSHPLLEKSRANRLVLKSYLNRDDITFHDLYERYPDFNIDVEYEKELLLQHEMIVWHHPFYWYSCPPLFKQWIDMVLEVGWAYGPDGDALEGKSIMQVITVGGGYQAYQESGYNRFPIREFLRPFEQTANLCKMNYFPPFVIHGTHRLSREQLMEYSSELVLFLDNWQDIQYRPNLYQHTYINDLLKKITNDK